MAALEEEDSSQKVNVLVVVGTQCLRHRHCADAQAAAVELDSTRTVC